jgi:hypothetical protein
VLADRDLVQVDDSVDLAVEGRGSGSSCRDDLQDAFTEERDAGR